MDPAPATKSADSHSASRVAWLLPLFIGSGTAALIYEIVWFQSLQLIVGASAISLGVLLSTFMGGMCAGSLLLPKLAPFSWHPLRVYAALELGIASAALLLLYWLPTVGDFYVERFTNSTNAGGQANVFLRAGVAGLCLLPPTILMGATLPAIARWFQSTPTGVASTSLFYSANIFGAVFGCLLASFYLLRVYDMEFATHVAVGLNISVAVIALLASWSLAYSPSPTRRDPSAQRYPSSFVPFLAIGLSGFAALGAEVLWTRELSLLLGATVYTFSLILAVFLIALGLGSSLGAAWSRRTANPSLAFAACQLAAAAGVLWAAWMTASSLPYWPIDVSLSINPWLTFQLDVVRVAWAVFPAALCWGASFPLALAAAANGQDTSTMVGSAYASNTLGAILGAIACSWWAIPIFGVQYTHQLLIAGLLFSAFMLTLRPANRRPAEEGQAASTALEYSQASVRLPFHNNSLVARSCLGLLLLLIGFAASRIPSPPAGLTAYGRYWATWLQSPPEFLYSADGLSASIAVSEFSDGQRNFHVSGKVVASSEAQDMRLQRLLGHLPALLCDDPKSVLIVGCGAGVTAGCFVTYPSIERIVICEIEAQIPKAAGEYFSEYNHAVMDDPRVEIVFDDARHFMLTTDETFDIITSDPIHPWVKGAAALYSLQYFELSRKHLNSGGIVTQWVPLYESSLEAVRGEVATFFEVFPKATIWTNDSEEGGYDLIMLGQDHNATFNLQLIDDKLGSQPYSDVRDSLLEAGFEDALSLARTFGGDRDSLQNWYSGATLNTDKNLHLQYSAGWALNNYLETQIRDSLQPYMAYPAELFQGSETQLAAIKLWFTTQAAN